MPGWFALEVVDQPGERVALGRDGLLAAGVGAQDGGDPDLDGHQGVLASSSGTTTTSSSVTVPSMIL